MRSALALLAAATPFAACGSEDSADEGQPSENEPPTVAELLCSGGPELLTPVVRGQRDGVHVRVRNDTNREVELDYELTRGGTGGGGSVAPRGKSEHVIPFAADEISIGCSAEALDRVELRVVDPLDELKTAEHECAAYRRNPPVPPKTLKGGDPLSIARRFLRDRGLRRTDIVERAASIAGEFATVRVVRNGRVVAAVWFDDPAAPHRIGAFEMCADFTK